MFYPEYDPSFRKTRWLRDSFCAGAGSCLTAGLLGAFTDASAVQSIIAALLISNAYLYVVWGFYLHDDGELDGRYFRTIPIAAAVVLAMILIIWTL